jgi:DNA-binding GntR family transcriptional regulator
VKQNLVNSQKSFSKARGESTGRKKDHRPQSNSTGQDPQAPDRRYHRMNLFDLAYEQIEDLIVSCRLKPGQYLTTQDLQDSTGLGRTPVHQAVSRLAADTIIFIRPRHGLQIATVDLERERVLLRLRGDIERFVIRLATERSEASHHNQMLYLARILRERGQTMTIEEFNKFDRRIDRLILTAAKEPFLEHTLRPLHTIFRRVGWLYHTKTATGVGPNQSIDCHIAVLETIANHQVKAATAASDKLIDFVDGMFDVIGQELDPALLDYSLEPLTAE